MNIILFSKEEINQSLPLSDRRAWHIINILKLREGDFFKMGVINGSKGEGFIKSIDDKEINIDFRLDREESVLYPLHLIIGLPRPQTVKKVLQDATAMGVRSISFAGTELGEKSYAMSKLWTENKYKEYVSLGAEQAYSSTLPEVKRYWSLKKALEDLPGDTDRLAYDNHPSAGLIRQFVFKERDLYIALGSERGWTDRERNLLQSEGFSFVHLGKRVLRCETAVVAGVALALEYKGLL